LDWIVVVALGPLFISAATTPVPAFTVHTHTHNVRSSRLSALLGTSNFDKAQDGRPELKNNLQQQQSLGAAK